MFSFSSPFRQPGDAGQRPMSVGMPQMGDRRPMVQPPMGGPMARPPLVQPPGQPVQQPSIGPAGWSPFGRPQQPSAPPAWNDRFGGMGAAMQHLSNRQPPPRQPNMSSDRWGGLGGVMQMLANRPNGFRGGF
jgi:hypothetical protein